MLAYRLLLRVLDSLIYRLSLLRGIVRQATPLPAGFSWSRAEDGTFWVQDGLGFRLWVSSFQRLGLYRRGFTSRFSALARSYGLDGRLDVPGITFIDVGANIGEFGVMLATVPGLTYVAFEPDPIAFRALEKNVKGHTLFPFAVSDETGESVLSLETGTADSSLQQLSNPTGGTVRVRTTTLDDALLDLDFGEIDVLKVEAEGSEPEVLRGATKTLQRTRICVVDAGPERQGRSTVAESIEILREAGFRLVDMRFPRGALVCVRAH